MSTLSEFKNRLAFKVFGCTRKDAWLFGICISCKKPALDRCYSAAGKKEYYISALCEECFDKICSEGGF